MEGSLVHRAITEENYRAKTRVLILLGESYPGRQRQLCPNNRVPAHESLARIEDVHRTALPFAQTSALPEHLCHHAVRVQTARKGVAVITVMRHDVIPGIQRRHRTDTRRFLTNVEMEESSNASQAVLLSARLFESTNQEHSAVEVQQVTAAQFLSLRDRLRDSHAVDRLRTGRLYYARLA